jgi:crotonobetainyl-CoA:carnitine CoA-transferase CaiB-like acyl-CoA transferase
MTEGPLSSLRILEVGHMLAGPYCGMLLADLGAEVIKIESPDGDLGRTISPHWIGPYNAYFASLNRSKKSVVIDLACADGQRTLATLCQNADALITNLRPSAIRKLGLTYAALKKHNSKLVCVALTGYGLDGPNADRPAYDYVVQALAGIADMTGNPGSPPTKTGYSAVDNSTGIMAALGLLAQIVGGKGGQVDVSLYDTMISQLNYLASGYLNAGERLARQHNGAHPYIVPAQMFPTRDGWLAMFISHDRFWKIFAAEVEIPEWLEDPRFSTAKGRLENRERVISAIEKLLMTQSTAHWVGRLEPLGLVIAGVQDMAAALDSRLTAERGMVQTLETEAGDIRVVGNPIKGDGMVWQPTPPPRLGQHTDIIFGDRG